MFSLLCSTGAVDLLVLRIKHIFEAHTHLNIRPAGAYKAWTFTHNADISIYTFFFSPHSVYFSYALSHSQCIYYNCDVKCVFMAGKLLQ